MMTMNTISHVIWPAVAIVVMVLVARAGCSPWWSWRTLLFHSLGNLYAAYERNAGRGRS
jgi:hypothetical protein